MARTAFAFGAWPPRSLPGWHWPNFSHGHRVYRGVGEVANVDFSAPVGFAQADTESISLAGLCHAASTRYTYTVRPVAGNGWLETPDLSNTCEFETDAAGEWQGNRPSGVQWLDATIQCGGSIELSWSWQRQGGEADPADFGLYYSTAPGITAGNPVATKAFSREGRYSQTFALSDGVSHWFAATARDASGVESLLSSIIGPFAPDATAPDPPSVTVSRTF